MNENESMYHNLWDAAKVVNCTKFMNAYVRKEG